MVLFPLYDAIMGLYASQISKEGSDQAKSYFAPKIMKLNV